MNFGWLRDPLDARDKSARDLLKGFCTFGDSVDWTENLPSPLNQKTTGSCVGQAGAGAFATKANIQSKGTTEFLPSAAFFYSIARMVEGNQRIDSGARIRNLMKAVAQRGVCPEEDWPFNVSGINTSPTWAAFRKAFDQKWLTGYYRVDSMGGEREADIKQALYEGHIPVFGMDVTTPFLDYSGGVISDMTGKIEGGHAMFLYGYHRSDFFMGQNSWGTSWGEEGRFRFGPRVLARFRDIWIFETVPTYSGT